MFKSFKFTLSLLLTLSFGVSAFAEHKAKHKKWRPVFHSDTAWVRSELTRMGLSQGFINESIKHYEDETFGKVLTLNLLGFMRPPGMHMNLVTPQAVSETAKFIKENQKAFSLAQQKYQVPPDVISALLWIETRHGDEVGDYDTVSVFLHLLQANRAGNRQLLTRLALEKNKEDPQYTAKELKHLMADRTKKKSQWAKEQIIALAAIRKEKHLNLKTLQGSYAGAFGLPQFIPSSYRAYAKALQNDHVPDLTKPADAIQSVGFYLSKNGWDSQDSDARVAALMKYNNSRDYADSILEISKRVLAVNPNISKSRSLSSTDASP